MKISIQAKNQQIFWVVDKDLKLSRLEQSTVVGILDFNITTI